MPEAVARENEIELVSFDPFKDPLRADHDEVLNQLLDHSPGFMMVEGRLSAYVATWDQVREVCRDHAAFSSVKPKDVPGMNRFDFFNSQPIMNYSDPPEHDKRRHVVNASFTRRRVEDMAPLTRELLNGVFGGLSTTDEVDAVSELCGPVINEVLLGGFMNVEPADRHIMFDLLAQFATLDKLGPFDPKPDSYLAAWNAGADYCHRVVEQARIENSQNLIGLIAAAAGDGTLSDGEMLAMMVVLLTGGMGTMTSAASSSLYWIATHPELKQRITDDPEVAGAVVEESIRTHPPVTYSMRFASRDYELNGRVIPAETPVYVMWAAANQDSAAFPDPRRFDVERPNGRAHVAFGFGVHNCIGNHVTRQVVSTIIREVVAQYPDFRLAHPEVDPEFSAGSRGRHLQRVPLVLGERFSG